jgi:hypothetical protein
MEPKFLIDQAILQKVVDYLTTRPFNEVSELISTVQQSATVYEEPTPAKEANKEKK